jgi:opacity protein-like surface antigen
MLQGAAALFLSGPVSAWAEPPGFPPRWEVEATPAVWASSLSGNAQVGPLPDASYTNHNGGKPNSAMLSIEWGEDDSGVLLDVINTKLSQDSDTVAGRKFANAPLDGRQKVYQLAGVVRSTDDPELFLDFIAGARYASVDIEQRLNGEAPCRDRTHWLNGFVGVRMLQKLSERWWLSAYGDVGGGGGHNSWQAQLGANFRVTDATTVKVGYRVLGLKYDKPDLNYDLRTGGLYAGVGMRF